MRKTVRVNFAGAGWDNATPEDYPFKDILEQHFAVEISPEPDYLIQKESADLYHGLLLRYPSANVRLYCPGEALAPDFNLFDYSFGFDPLAYGDRYLQWDILHLFRDDVLADWPLDQPRAFARQPERFCNFCYSNAQANPLRDQFYEFLSQHEPVESIGRHLRNTTREEDPALGWRENKIKLLADYRFTIAFENACFPGYTTEKLIHPLLAGSIPIYWGNPRVGEISTRRPSSTVTTSTDSRRSWPLSGRLPGIPSAWRRCGANPSSLRPSSPFRKPSLRRKPPSSGISSSRTLRMPAGGETVSGTAFTRKP